MAFKMRGGMQVSHEIYKKLFVVFSASHTARDKNLFRREAVHQITKIFGFHRPQIKRPVEPKMGVKRSKAKRSKKDWKFLKSIRFY